MEEARGLVCGPGMNLQRISGPCGRPGSMKPLREVGASEKPSTTLAGCPVVAANGRSKSFAISRAGNCAGPNVHASRTTRSSKSSWRRANGRVPVTRLLDALVRGTKVLFPRYAMNFFLKFCPSLIITIEVTIIEVRILFTPVAMRSYADYCIRDRYPSFFGFLSEKRSLTWLESMDL